MFQFHNGSIKRDLVFKVIAEDDRFQFHNGSIKSPKKINRDIIENPRYFYKQKITSTFKSRQRPVVRNSREVDDMAWLCPKLR